MLVEKLHLGCYAYLHGHEVGGTNPSLLKAMGCGNCAIAFDSVFNAEVLVGTGLSKPTAASTSSSSTRGSATSCGPRSPSPATSIFYFLGMNQAWAWQFPLRDGKFSVGVVVDKEDFQKSGRSEDQFFQSLIGRSGTSTWP